VVFTTRAGLKVKVNAEVVYTPNLLNAIVKYRNESISDSVKEQIYSELV
jgi:hypothetical protein